MSSPHSSQSSLASEAPNELNSLAGEIAQFFSDEALANGTFAVGGTIPIRQTVPGSVSALHSAVLRWDATDADAPPASRRVGFPLTTDADYVGFAQLFQDMQPATFGLGNQHVLDEEYRKALKLPASAFAVNFSPYDLGIIDTAAQYLLPRASKEDKTIRGIHAELYNINIYSGPSGKFKAHVDTPRSKYQIGSLVVCFPTKHDGGELVVKHAGNTSIFDWAAKSDQPLIQWAAFYSDCEHEVLEVTSGHRVTITYNLFATKAKSGTLRSLPDPKSLPMYHRILDLVTAPRFQEKDRLLGFHSAFAYPHTSKDHGLPLCLKGQDMEVYEIFRGMGHKVHLSAVTPHRGDYHRSESDAATDGKGFSDDEPSDSDYEPSDMDCESEDGYYPRDTESMLCNQTLVRSIREASNLGMMGDSDDENEFLEYGLGVEKVNPRDIVWINNIHRYSKRQLSYIAHGNEPSDECIYSYFAMVVEIPAKAVPA